MEFGIICDIFRKLWREVFPDVREDWFGPVCQPEKTALDCTRPVALSSVQSFAVLELVKTGLSLGLSVHCFGSKKPDRTGLSNTNHLQPIYNLFTTIYNRFTT